MRFASLVIAATLLAGCGKKESSSSESSGSGSSSTSGSSSSGPSGGNPGTSGPARAWKPIAGGQEIRFAGASADIPSGWTANPQGPTTILVPPGVNQVAPDEVYAFMGEPSLKTLDAPGLDAWLDNALMSFLQVAVKRSGNPTTQKHGELDGKTWSWTAQLMDGRNVEIRSYAFVASYTGSLVVIATPDALKKRMPEIEQILGSLRRPAAAAISAATLCNTWVRAFGEHTALSGKSNEQQITFYANSRFHYHSEGTSHGIFHSISSQTDLDGSWKLTGDQLSGAIDGGASGTFTLEARNEAGTGAAVIAIDGTEFRQVDGRGW